MCNLKHYTIDLINTGNAVEQRKENIRIRYAR